MPRYSKKPKVSEQTKDEAMKIARGTQRPGQTKEQTRLIAQGIQKGIDQYKKQQKAKARELDKKLRKASSPTEHGTPTYEAENDRSSPGGNRSAMLPWVLLVLSWVGFALFVYACQ